MTNSLTRLALAGLVAATAPAVAAPAVAAPAVAAPAPPNILVILADDLGFADLGAYGSEIATPNLDRLAADGLRLDQMYASPACSPTRSMLLTGHDNHQAGLGSMVEILTPQQRGRPGYEGYLNPALPTIAERLKAAGYATLMSGKWHLGKEDDQIPAARGFDQSFALLQGAHNHYGFDQSGAYKAYGASTDYRLNASVTEWPKDGYSSDVFTDRLLEFLDNVPAGQPFFGYLAYTAPHWPLQAPAATIAHYRGVYDAGPEAVRAARLTRMRALGVAGADAAVRPLDSGWADLSPEQRATEARKMEVYAAMVEQMDSNIGRVLDALRQSGRLENTLIIFLSDNGPDPLTLGVPLNPNNVSEPMDVPLDNSLANLGAGDSYVSYGPAWAAVSAGPFAGAKGNVLEGGIRVPAIVAGPGVRHGVSSAMLHVTDIAPTLLAVAGAGADTTLPGHSWTPLVAGTSKAVRAANAPLDWELFYRAAARRGTMKAVYLPNRIPLYGPVTAPGEVEWELYDLARDPGETDNLAARQPRTLHKLQRQWRAYARENGVVLLPEEEAQQTEQTGH